MMHANRLSFKDTVSAAATFVALLILSCGLASTAHAENNSNTAARVNATIKPCFGMLLDVQLKTCGGRHYQPKGHTYGYHGKSTSASATIYCDTARYGAVEDVARRIRPGGVLVLKGRNRSCVGTLDIKNSITIIGDGFGPNSVPALVAPDGQPCLRVSPSAKRVTLKNIYLYSPRGQMAACIDAANTELTLQNTLIRYEGDNAAVVLSGGRLNLIDGTHIIAKTRSSAVAVTDSVLFAENTQIASTSSGLYAVLVGDSTIQGVSFQQLADWHGFERGEGATGVEIHLDSRGAIMTLNDLKITHFAEGLILDGAGEILVSNSLVSGSTHGVTSSLDRLRLIENTIIATEIGINVSDGTAYIGRNQIAKVRTAGILASSAGEIRAVDNAIDAGGAGCQSLKWGNLDPSLRTCTPWYEGSMFDAPSDADDQNMFADFWPGRLGPVAASGTSGTMTGTNQDPVGRH